MDYYNSIMKNKMKESDIKISKRSLTDGMVYSRKDMQKQEKAERAAIKKALNYSVKPKKREGSFITSFFSKLGSSKKATAQVPTSAPERQSLNLSKAAKSVSHVDKLTESVKQPKTKHFSFAPKPISEDKPDVLVKEKIAQAKEKILKEADKGTTQVKDKKMVFEKENSFFSNKIFIYLSIAASVSFIALSLIFVPPAFDKVRKEVSLNDNGFMVKVNSTESTVAGLLLSTGVVLGEHDAVETDLAAPLEDGMEIVIRRAVQISIMSGNEQKEVFMMSGTVDQALQLAGVDVAQYDEVYPSEDSYLTPGMSIIHINVEKEEIKVTEKVGFREIERKNAKLEKGKTKKITEGREGIVESVFEVTYKNGVETSREKVSSKVLQEAQDRVTEVGTMVVKKTEMGNVSLKGYLLKTPQVSKIYSKTLYEHQQKPKPDSTIIAKVLVARNVTAYTHTGRRTASGTWPRIGTVACYWKALPKYTKIYVPRYGYGRIEDQGAGTDSSAIDLDLFMDTKAECGRWGRKKNYEFYVLK